MTTRTRAGVVWIIARPALESRTGAAVANLHTSWSLQAACKSVHWANLVTPKTESVSCVINNA